MIYLCSFLYLLNHWLEEDIHHHWDGRRGWACLSSKVTTICISNMKEYWLKERTRRSCECVGEKCDCRRRKNVFSQGTQVFLILYWKYLITIRSPKFSFSSLLCILYLVKVCIVVHTYLKIEYFAQANTICLFSSKSYLGLIEKRRIFLVFTQINALIIVSSLNKI